MIYKRTNSTLYLSLVSYLDSQHRQPVWVLVVWSNWSCYQWVVIHWVIFILPCALPASARQEMLLTEDLVQWLLADQKVSDGWRGLAVRLELAHLIPAISEDPQKCKLKLLFAAWREARYDCYSVETLKTILSQEVQEGIPLMIFQYNFHIRDLLTCTDGFVSSPSSLKTKASLNHSDPEAISPPDHSLSSQRWGEGSDPAPWVTFSTPRHQLRHPLRTASSSVAPVMSEWGPPVSIRAQALKTPQCSHLQGGFLRCGDQSVPPAQSTPSSSDLTWSNSALPFTLDNKQNTDYQGRLPSITLSELGTSLPNTSYRTDNSTEF